MKSDEQSYTLNRTKIRCSNTTHGDLNAVKGRGKIDDGVTAKAYYVKLPSGKQQSANKGGRLHMNDKLEKWLENHPVPVPRDSNDSEKKEGGAA